MLWVQVTLRCFPRTATALAGLVAACGFLSKPYGTNARVNL
jgi:hypothetical protein